MFREHQKEIDRQILLEKAGLNQSATWARGVFARALIRILAQDLKIVRWALNLIHIVLVGTLMIGLFDTPLIDRTLASASAATGLRLPAFDWQFTFWAMMLLTGLVWGHAALVKQRTLLLREGRL